MPSSADDSTKMEAIGRYCLSLIASYLDGCDGTCLFLSKKQWTKQLLPIFRLPATVGSVDGQRPVYRHKFIALPVQDANVRLQRLNTRRLKKQKINCCGLSTQQLAAKSETRSYPPLLRFHSKTDGIFRPGTTVLVSYPRSGNTLLRTLLEATTQVVTGSDTRPDRTLSLALADRHDLVGEGITSPSQTPLVKTHWPERIGFRAFTAHRAVLLVRNPFDAIDSYWNLNVTNTHTDKVTEEIYRQHAKFYFDLVRNEMKVWLQFLDYWNSQDVQVLWMRYEDLITDTKTELLRALHFCTGQNEEIWQERVSFIVQQRGHGYQSLSLGVAAQRKTQLPFGRSLERYPSELQKELHGLDKNGWLKLFGYHVYEQDFPRNIVESGLPPVPATVAKSGSKGAQDEYIVINSPARDELRSPLSPYGRKMRDWRRRYTADDTDPFPTTAGSKRSQYQS